jgi:hypothetical protein
MAAPLVAAPFTEGDAGLTAAWEGAAASYEWQDDAIKSYALWIAINRARLLIVRALKWRSAHV